MPIRLEIEGKGSRKPIKIWTNDIDSNSQAQLINIACLPIVHSHVAAMPDVHLGHGATVGSVIAFKGAVIPSAVGVDIGCGMIAFKLNLKASDLPDDLSVIRHAIERSVPVGFNSHEGIAELKSGKPAILSGEKSQIELLSNILEANPKLYTEKSSRVPSKVWNQVGTLGGGNHFIEICLDKEDNVWVMLHSGSRNIGKVLAEYYVARAKEYIDLMGITIPDKELAWLPESDPNFKGYVDAVEWAQGYAMTNRGVMMRLVMEEIQHYIPHAKVIAGGTNCHHNYISYETHYGESVYLTRKGAIRADKGMLGIIPGSMGAKSFIVRGKGNPESFNSCSHGAGRKMSRGQAKRSFTIADLEAQTKGIECRKDQGVLDEIPGAYKDIDVVMANQTDLVEVVAELRQILCIKG